MKKAAVDVGTNSCRLLIVDTSETPYRVLRQELRTTRLGEGITDSGRLSPGAIQRTMTALREFENYIVDSQVQRVAMVGTSALRDVENAGELREIVSRELGLDLKIIEGRKEARLSYKGVSLAYPGLETLLIDIGGGSTEFIWKQEGKFNYTSLDLGAVRVTEKFLEDPASPVSQAEADLISEHICKILQKKLTIDIESDSLLGVGGTITTLAAMDLRLKEYDPQLIHGHRLGRDNISGIYHELAGKNLSERQKLPGLNPERADIIVGGVIILQAILEKLQFTEVIVSEYDLLYGIVEELC